MTESVPGAARRARKRDQANRLGEVQKNFEGWLNTNAGQIFLIVLAGVALMVALSVGP